MDLTFSERETAFRDELRAWFAANDPGPEPVHAGGPPLRLAARLPAPPLRGRLGRAALAASSTAGAARR